MDRDGEDKMLNNRAEKMRLLKYLMACSFILILVSLITSSRALAQWLPYSSYGFPYVTAPPPNFSGYIWTSPTTANNPNTPPGITQTVFVSPVEGQEWQSPYYQQTGYNFDNPFSGYSFPYNGLSSYSYNLFGGYGQPFSNNWFNPWQQPYQNYAWGLSYPFGGYSWNPFTPQFSYNYNNWFNPWQSWTPTDDCSGDGILYRKPAIYLYPEEDTEVKVTLDINGIFTKTIPSYNSGWEVFATKEGKIFSKDMKESYDYLFWEAQMNNLTLPDNGWVVAQENLIGWFDENLTKLGLNERESADFMEYWLDKLSYSEYYEIKLLDQSFLEKNAQLTISPSPDTVIRVIFYFTPLGEYKVLEAPAIDTPKRKGFVVLEWGGIFSE